MAHIVIITGPTAGKIQLSGELARRLRQAGHRATIAGHSAIADRLRALGEAHLLLGEPAPDAGAPGGAAPRPSPPARSGSLLARLGQLRTIRQRRGARLEVLDLDGFSATMRRLAPDLILVDLELPEYVMAAWSTGTVVAAWTDVLSLWKRRGLPPLSSGIVPGVGWRGHPLAVEWAWARLRIQRWLRHQRARVAQVGADYRSLLRLVARRTGFPYRREALEYQWLFPCVYRSLPVIEFNALELELPHEPHPTVRYVGPLLDGRRRRPTAAADQAAAAARLEELYRRRRRGETSALVYAAFGAWYKKDDRDFFRRVLAAAGSRPDWDLIVGLGGRVDAASLGTVPDNAHLLAWAPQLEVLEHADCFVHHAGIHSINESIVSGVPMVAYPYDGGDTPGAAARVAFHGLGVVGDRGDDAGTIARHIDRVLGDAGFRSRVGRMREHLLAYERDNRAVRAIEALLRSPPGA